MISSLIFLVIPLISVLLDTCFLERFKKNSALSEDLNILINEAGFELLVHPYVYENEMSVLAYAKPLFEKDYCRVVKYDEFIPDDLFREYYKSIFLKIYNEFYDRLMAMGSLKAEKMKRLEDDSDIFSVRYAGSSIGDVHLVLMALFMGVPIILSEDNNDMRMIYDIASSRINSGSFQLIMYQVSDVVELIRNKDNRTISGKELKRLRRAYS